jgi:hypothetical protein
MIDPKTRDVASLAVSANVIDSQVQLAMTVLRGSGAAVAVTGQRFRDVGKLTDNASNLLETEARTALATLVNRGDISIESITVVIDSPNTWAELTLNYINQRAVGLKTRVHTQRVEASTR